jgi:hypothetical protein
MLANETLPSHFTFAIQGVRTVLIIGAGTIAIAAHQHARCEDYALAFRSSESLDQVGHAPHVRFISTEVPGFPQVGAGGKVQNVGGLELAYYLAEAGNVKEIAASPHSCVRGALGIANIDAADFQSSLQRELDCICADEARSPGD